MIYVGFLLLALILQAVFRFSVLNDLSLLTHFFHFHCLQRIVTTSGAASEMKALVCGENFSKASDSEIFVASGLIHLFVVSGAHLIVLEKIVTSRFVLGSTFSKSSLFVLLFIYALACEMNPPVTRSLVSMIFTFLTMNRKIYWTDNFKILLIGLLTLCLNTEWLNSISLQLSWLAALAVSMNRLYFIQAGLLLKQFIFFIILWPVLIFFQTPSPAILLSNLMLTPFLEFILFPLGLLTWLFPFLSNLFDQIIYLLKHILQLLEFKLNAQSALTQTSVVILGWVFLLGMHFVLHFVEMKRRQETHV